MKRTHGLKSGTTDAKKVPDTFYFPRNTRRKIGRVTRFRAETDQATRWLAYALTEVEKGFRRIAGHKDLPLMITALKRKES